MNNNKEKVLQQNRANMMCVLAEGSRFKGQTLINGNLVATQWAEQSACWRRNSTSLKSEISLEVEFLTN